jgi:hypothetical protein
MWPPPPREGLGGVGGAFKPWQLWVPQAALRLTDDFRLLCRKAAGDQRLPHPMSVEVEAAFGQRAAFNQQSHRLHKHKKKINQNINTTPLLGVNLMPKYFVLGRGRWTSPNQCKHGVGGLSKGWDPKKSTKCKMVTKIIAKNVK